jgi:hypothetical protein
MRFMGDGSKNLRSYAVLLSSVLIVFALASGFHYHDDNEDHDQCQVCAATGHSAAVLTKVLSPNYVGFFLIKIIVDTPRVRPFFKVPSASRAPPFPSL